MALLALVLGVASADEPLVQADVGGHLKSFYVATFPYDSPLLPPDPTGVGVVNTRLNVDVDIGDNLSLQAHHTLTLSPRASGGGALSTGVNAAPPEALPLSYTLLDSGTLAIQGRMDRLSAKLSVPHLDLTLGRQPISFGSGAFFTPMDLVNPFSPAVIDTEYKPGVDAARADVYIGMSGRITAVAAYAGSWDSDGLVAVGYGQGTVGLTDIGGFAGWVRGDMVLGSTVVSSIGPVAIHADLTVTVPEDDAFVRGVVGADWRPFAATTL